MSPGKYLMNEIANHTVITRLRVPVEHLNLIAHELPPQSPLLLRNTLLEALNVRRFIIG